MKKTILILIIFLPSLLHAQFFIKGQIIDAETNEALIYVNIAFKGSTKGTITNQAGLFSLSAPAKPDTLMVSFMGYEMKEIPVKPNQNQYLNIALLTEAIEISEVDVTPGENPAFEILRNINKNKKENNYFEYPEFKMRVYNKISFSLNNVNEAIFKSKALKAFDFILAYADSSEFTGDKILPVFLSETVSDFYQQSSPRKTKEIILANKMSGVENKSYSQFTGQIYADLDYYDNIIPLFEKNFINPIAAYARPYYKFYLMDSMSVDGDYCYHIMFKPRFKRELTFSGDMYVDKASYALKKIKVRISPDANINYVKDVQAEILYQKSSDGKWYPKTSTLDVLLELSEKQISVFGHKTTQYSQQTSTIENKALVFDESTPEIYTTSEIFKLNDYWESERPLQLSGTEASIYKMVDTLMSTKRFQRLQKLSTMLYLGYWEMGDFEYGPYYSTYSYNAIEGNRFRLGGRTSNNFSTNIMLSGYGAFGDKDQRFKYGVGALYLLNKTPRTSIRLNYKDDLTQLSVSSNAFSSDNISNSIFSVSANTDLLRIRSADIDFFHQWPKGFGSTLKLNYRDIFPSSYMSFTEPINSFSFQQITDASASLNIRFAYGEKYLEGEFERTAIPSDFPIVNLNIVYGNAFMNSNTYPYAKLEISYDHNFIFGFLGYFEYSLSAGKIFGEVPYPLLKLHAGNETYYLDTKAFNLMNYYEFASDNYFQASFTHHFDGLIMSKIPLVNNLDLRSLLIARGVIGSLSQLHSDVVAFPGNLSSMEYIPYIEAGVGIENIFKIMRVDAMWRISHTKDPNATNFGIRAMFQIIL